MCYTYNGGRMKKVVLNIFIFLYFILTVITTYCLLSYNKFNTVEFKDKYLLSANKYLTDFDGTSLLVVTKDSNYEIGEDVLYYDVNGNIVTVKMNKIKNIEKVNEKESTIVLENDLTLSSENVLGKKSKTTTYAFIGAIFSLLTSRWGYLFIIIFPMLVAFIYEIFAIVKEIRKRK